MARGGAGRRFPAFRVNSWRASRESVRYEPCARSLGRVGHPPRLGGPKRVNPKSAICGFFVSIAPSFMRIRTRAPMPAAGAGRRRDSFPPHRPPSRRRAAGSRRLAPGRRPAARHRPPRFVRSSVPGLGSSTTFSRMETLNRCGSCGTEVQTGYWNQLAGSRTTSPFHRIAPLSNHGDRRDRRVDARHHEQRDDDEDHDARSGR